MRLGGQRDLLMRSDKAIVRQHLEKIRGVNRTWFEWESDADMLVKTLVVEVDFDTDPTSSAFRQNVVNVIEKTAKAALAEETTMVISNLRIIPREADR